MFIGSVLLYSLFTLLHNDTDYYTRFFAVCQGLLEIFLNLGRKTFFVFFLRE